MRLWLIRAILVPVLVFILAWDVLYRLWTEAKGIPFYIWCDWREDFGAFVDTWRTGRFD